MEKDEESHHLTPKKEPPVRIEWEVGGAQEPLLKQEKRNISVSLAIETDPPIVHPVG
jgi:hypothetical protein